MIDLTLIPYAGWAFGIAAIFYSTIVFAGKHLSPDAKGHLALWLKGDYQGSWAEIIGHVFDRIFGERHLSLRCFLTSAMASIVAVFAIWVLLEPILGVLSVRAAGTLDLVQVLLLGALINVLPDYASLFQTRMVLHLFRRVRTWWGQALMLLLDVVATGVIIYGAIQVFRLVRGEEVISVIEMAALFSPFAVFFYSTFLTSVVAWIFAATSGFVWLFTRLGLDHVLDVDGDPARQVGLFGGVVVFAASLMVAPLIMLNDARRVAFDEMLCAWSPEAACRHAERLSRDEAARVNVLEIACAAGWSACQDAAFDHFVEDASGSVRLFQKACARNGGNSCEVARVFDKYAFVFPLIDSGIADTATLGFADDLFAKSVERVFQTAKTECLQPEALNCTNVGILFERISFGEKSLGLAAVLYQQDCARGSERGCAYATRLAERMATEKE